MRLDRGLERERILEAASRIGLPVEAKQVDQLQVYLDLLERWNRIYNLTAVRDREAMRVQHLFDCLAALPPVQRRFGDPRPAAAGGPAPVGTKRLTVVDIGSGGGLPGLVWSVLWPRSGLPSAARLTGLVFLAPARSPCVAHRGTFCPADLHRGRAGSRPGPPPRRG
jgi:hypothetical protein